MARLAIGFGSVLFTFLIGAIVWWRLGVAEARERQKQAGSAAE